MCTCLGAPGLMLCLGLSCSRGCVCGLFVCGCLLVCLLFVHVSLSVRVLVRLLGCMPACLLDCPFRCMVACSHSLLVLSACSVVFRWALCVRLPVSLSGCLAVGLAVGSVSSSVSPCPASCRLLVCLSACPCADLFPCYCHVARLLACLLA